MHHDLSDDRVNDYGAKLWCFAKVAATFLLITASILGFAAPANAQNVLAFTPATTTGAGSVQASLSWSTTPSAQSCTASGHSSWTGTKAASGTAVLPAITSSGTYALTLSCSWPSDTSAVLKWTPPTTNTDGSSLAKCASSTTTGACLAKYQLYHSTSSTLASPDMIPVNDPNAITYTYTALPAGTHYFGVEVVNGDGVPAAMSNIASKAVTGTQSVTRTVTINVNPKPSAATGVTAM